METNIDNKLSNMEILLKDIKDILQQNEENKEYISETKDGEVTFKFNVNDRMVSVLPNLNKIMSALEDLQNYRRELYKYDVKGEIYYNKETKDVKELDNMSLDEHLGEGYSTYVKVDSVIDKIDNILDGLYTIINEYWY